MGEINSTKNYKKYADTNNESKQKKYCLINNTIRTERVKTDGWWSWLQSSAGG